MSFQLTASDLLWMESMNMKCQEKGCEKEAIECHYSKVEEDELHEYTEYYCEEHAVIHGYCKNCGTFAAIYTCFDKSGFCAFCKSDTQID